MTPEEIAAQLKALDNEFHGGNINLMNYKRVAMKLFDLAYEMAREHAELMKRVAEIERKEAEK